MPFEPYKGSSGPDFLSLALSLRQQRSREESQRRRDEAALIRAKSQAQNDALTRAEKALDVQQKYNDSLAGASERASAATQIGDARMERAPEFLTNPDFQGPLRPADSEMQAQFPTPESFAVTQYPEYGTIVNRRATQLVQAGVEPAMAMEQAVRDLELQQRVAGNERERALAQTKATEDRGVARTIASEERGVARTIAQEGRKEEQTKRAEDRAAERDLPQRQSRIEERVIEVAEAASIAYRAANNPNLSKKEQAKANAKLDALIDPLVPEYAAAFGVTPGQARRTMMAPIAGSPVVRAQELQEAGADISAKDLAEAESKTGVLAHLSREMRRVSARRKETKDPEELARLDEQFDALQTTRASIADDEGESTISSGEIVKATRGYLSARAGLRNTEELLGLVESGQIKTGPAGFVTSLGLRVAELTNDILSDPEVPDEMKSVARQMAESGSNQISVGGGFLGLTGKQLNLSADQLFLAWEIVKAKRESARFTLLELQSTLKLVDFTDPSKPKAQMVEMLRKVVNTQVDAQGANSVIMRMGGVNPDHTYQRFLDDTAQFRIGSPSVSGGNSSGDQTPRNDGAASSGNNGQGSGVNDIVLPGSPGFARSAASRIADGTYTPGGQ